MGYEIPALLGGLIIGALLVYLLLRERSSPRLLLEAKSQLEAAIRKQYESLFAEWKATTLAETIKQNRVDAVDTSRAVLKGKIAEQMAPMLPHFLSTYNPADARFIGSPIDYLIFKNMSLGKDSEDSIEIILLDVKTGNAGLTPLQKKIQTAVNDKRVSFHTLRFDVPTSESNPPTMELQDFQVVSVEDIPTDTDTKPL